MSRSSSDRGLFLSSSSFCRVQACICSGVILIKWPTATKQSVIVTVCYEFIFRFISTGNQRQHKLIQTQNCKLTRSWCSHGHGFLSSWRGSWRCETTGRGTSWGHAPRGHSTWGHPTWCHVAGGHTTRGHTARRGVLWCFVPTRTSFTGSWCWGFLNEVVGNAISSRGFCPSAVVTRGFWNKKITNG